MFKFVTILILIVFFGCSNDESGSESVDITPTFKKIAITNNTTNGLIGSTANNAMNNADTLCDNEFPGYKALLGSSVRNSSLDWVLKPNTEYRREDETTVIGTTNSSGIFDFPLDASFSSSAGNIWTGLIWDFTSPNGANCGNFTIGTGDQGNYGDPTVTGSSAVISGGHQCHLTYRLACVQQ